MTQALVAILIWLHQLATVVWMGQLVLASVVYMPLFVEQLEGPALGRVVGGMARRVTPLIWGSVAIFMITGIPMTIGRMGQAGIGHPWSVLILIKHAVVVLMIVLSVSMQKAAAAAGAPEGSPPQVEAAIGRSRRASSALMVCGIVVLLLTAAAEAL